MAEQAIVERFIDIDAGHRVARHESKCRNLHGHRYRLTVQISGPIRDDDSPEHGMVIDFARVKEALSVIHDEWDHRFLLGSDDPLLAAMSGLEGVVVLDVQPTAENLAALAASRLGEMLAPLRVVKVMIQETTACSATVRP
jgi:6-pyruvoyltetrahydropterin/6-carboxytetrahydropterin synthase